MAYKNPKMGSGSANGFADARGDSTGSSVGLKRKLPSLGTQHGDARGRAPGSESMTKTGSSYWPKADQTVPRRSR